MDNPATTTEQGNRKPLATLRDVHFSYTEDSEALRGVTLDIYRGEYLCILGSNGSGKSTLIQLLNALLLPSAGEVQVFGIDTGREPQRAIEIRRRAAMVFQHPEDQMVTSIVADDVAFGPENLAVPQPCIAERVDAALAAVSMSERAQSDPADLSGGQRQRVAIAGALAMQPDMLLLDEPAAMLDTQGRHDIQNIIARLHEQGITVVHVTHFMDDALKADRVLVMNAGAVALEGTPAEVFEHHDLLKGLGLELPFSSMLGENLRALGFDAPATLREEELADTVAAQLPPHREGRHDPTSGLGANDSPHGDSSNPAIVFDQVTFSYANASSARKKQRRKLFGRTSPRDASYPLALDKVSFTVAHGSITALIGHTGSGKSTCIELACALKVPQEGSVQVAGMATTDLGARHDLRRHIGYVSQLPERQLFAETVFDDVAFGPRNLGLTEKEVAERVRRSLEATGLRVTDELLRRSPFALSGGQQRCVALAGVLAMGQEILVLDEPMAGLDPVGRDHMRALMRSLREQGTTLLVVTHDMDDVAELADHVVVLQHGRVTADGTPRDVFSNPVVTDDREGCLGLGTPCALRFARLLAARGAQLAPEPLTMVSLTHALAQEVHHGAAR